jgi:hypothetical protein
MSVRQWVPKVLVLSRPVSAIAFETSHRQEKPRNFRLTLELA